MLSEKLSELLEIKDISEDSIYTAAFLDNPSELLKWWEKKIGPLLSEKYSHHVTMTFKPSIKEIQQTPLGKRVKLHVTGYAEDNKAQAVVVTGPKRKTPGILHITVATDGTKPLYSNTLLSKGHTKINGPVLWARIGLFDEKERFDLAGTIYEQETAMKLSDALSEAIEDESLPELPEDPWKYFKKVPGAILVPISKLSTIRARPKGIKNAAKYMRLAYDGKMERRKPISLRQEKDGKFTVLDGNSTTANARRSGWKNIVGKIEV